MTPRWALRIGLLLSLFTIARMGMTLVRPWGAFGIRPYGIMDNYYYAGQVRKAGPVIPVWTNWPAIYFIMGWPVPGNDFLAQINDGASIDWNTPPYDKVQTRIYFYHNVHALPKYWDGWSYEDQILDRGQFTLMRVWRRSSPRS